MHLEARHGKRPCWFEELGIDSDLDAAHAWEHGTRPVDHEPMDLGLMQRLEIRAS